MNAPEENDPLDALLREQNTYLEDGGFTSRVIQALPNRRRSWLRPMILLGATAIGSVLAIIWLPWKSLPALNPSVLFSLDSQALLPWMVLASVIATLIWSVIAALQWED